MLERGVLLMNLGQTVYLWWVGTLGGGAGISSPFQICIHHPRVSQLLSYLCLDSGGWILLKFGVRCILQHPVHLSSIFCAVYDHCRITLENDNVGVFSEIFDGSVHTFVKVALGGMGSAECLANTHSQLLGAL